MSTKDEQNRDLPDPASICITKETQIEKKKTKDMNEQFTEKGDPND